jgi:hypothetical protein
VFPLSWIRCIRTQSIAGFLVVQMIGACLPAWHRGLRPDRRPHRPPQHAGHAGAADRGVQPALRPRCWAAAAGQDTFILVGFVLLGLSYGQAAGAVTARTSRRVPLHRLTAAWPG